MLTADRGSGGSGIPSVTTEQILQQGGLSERPPSVRFADGILLRALRLPLFSCLKGGGMMTEDARRAQGIFGGPQKRHPPGEPIMHHNNKPEAKRIRLGFPHFPYEKAALKNLNALRRCRRLLGSPAHKRPKGKRLCVRGPIRMRTYRTIRSPSCQRSTPLPGSTQCFRCSRAISGRSKAAVMGSKATLYRPLKLP